MQRRRTHPFFTQAHLPASSTQMHRRRISLLHAGAAPPHLLPHGSRRYSAALPPSRCSWLRVLSLPSAPSLPLAAAPSGSAYDPGGADDTGGAGFDRDERGGSCMASPYRFPLLLARRRGRFTPCERLVA